MAMIKRTSPGPKIGPIGSTLGQKKEIGTKGNTTGSQSTEGGQHSFMPIPAAKVGESKGTKTGQASSERSENFYDFLPRKAGQKK